MPTPETRMKRQAHISQCGRYRYTLLRQWDDQRPTIPFIGLNPSTADAEQDDPTIRRCIGFARAWGYGGLVMLNLFAFRATNPADMMRADDPVGPLNDPTLRSVCVNQRVICCWGAHGGYQRRDRAVRSLLGNIGATPLALALTLTGQPRHPLYLRRDCRPFTYELEAAHA